MCKDNILKRYEKCRGLKWTNKTALIFHIFEMIYKSCTSKGFNEMKIILHGKIY